MILLVSTCSQKLSEEEFVKPISKLINGRHEIRDYSEKIGFDRFKKIIICGTALKDNDYLRDLGKFAWIRSVDIPVLGICSGMQVIALSFGAELTKQKQIGMKKIRTTRQNLLFSGDFEAYELHRNGLSDLDEFDLLAKTGKSVQAIKHRDKEIYGIMFHPEVRNAEIIKRFLRLN